MNRFVKDVKSQHIGIEYMRKCEVYLRNCKAGVLTEEMPNRYTFVYDKAYLNDASCPSIALSLPKREKEYVSTYLFPCFTNMLSEGYNRQMHARIWHIDENDDFGIMLRTAGYDTIGAITIKPIEL